MWAEVLMLSITLSLAFAQDSTCAGTNYTAANGLTFQEYCSSGLSSNSVVNIFSATNLVDCMNQCATLDVPCLAVNYNFASNQCTTYDVVPSDSVSSGGSTSSIHCALALNFYDGLSPQCSISSNTNHTADNGMLFTSLCHQSIGNNTFCPGNLPCPLHASNINDCINFCSHAQPLCAAAFFDSQMTFGYSNCYLQSSNYTTSSGPPIYDYAYAPSFPIIDRSCTNGSVITTSKGSQFKTGCGADRVGNDLPKVHALSLQACIEECGAYSNTTNGPCVAVAWDSTWDAGWENCFLKDAPGSNNPHPDLDYAVLFSLGSGTSNNNGTTSNNNNPSSSSSIDSPSQSKSKVWIAYIFIGIVVLVVLATVMLIHRRKRTRRGANEMLAPTHQNMAEGAVASDRLLNELHSDAVPPREMYADTIPAGEMHAPTKGMDPQHTPIEMPDRQY